MKKIFTILLAAAVIFCGAGQAMAYFDDSHVALIVYNSTDNEVGVDLGEMDALTGAAAGSVNLGQFGPAVTGWDDLSLSVYTAYSDATAAHFIFGTSEMTAPSVNTGAANSFYFGSGPNHTLMSAEGAQVSVTAASEVNSYTNKIDLGAPGQMAGFHSSVDPSIASVNLAALDAGGFVDMYLYEFDYSGNLVAGTGTDYQAIVRLSEDGSVTINPTVVPIPGAMILFASGLLGLVGIRRRKSASV